MVVHIILSNEYLAAVASFQRRFLVTFGGVSMWSQIANGLKAAISFKLQKTAACN